MPPVLRSDDGCNTVIRPLIYLREYEMSRWAEICGYPLFPKDLCGVGENLKRKEIKALMTQWDKEFDSRIYNLFMSTTRVGRFASWLTKTLSTSRISAALPTSTPPTKQTIEQLLLGEI